MSDDTVLHLANAFCLSDHPDLKSPRVYIKLVDYYKDAMKDMKGTEYLYLCKRID